MERKRKNRKIKLGLGGKRESERRERRERRERQKERG